MGMDRGQVMGNYFPAFQVISVIRPPSLPGKKEDRHIWRMNSIVRRFVFCVLFRVKIYVV